MAFLDQPGAVIEDWGCGTTYAKKFVRRGTYRGIDGSPVDATDKVVDLRQSSRRSGGHEMHTRCIDVDPGTRVPTISFRKEDIAEMIRHIPYREERLTTESEHRAEHIFYLEKPSS